MLAKGKKLDKTILNERLSIRRKTVLFRINISRLTDESFGLIFVKQLGLANLHLHQLGVDPT